MKFEIEPNHAFAMRNFDRERILQRPFVKEVFSFVGNKTDAEFLKSMSATEFDSFDDTQMKLDLLDTLLIVLVDYLKHIRRHGDRLTKYAHAVEYKITTDPTSDIDALRARHDRAGRLSMNYCGVVRKFGGLTEFGITGIAVEDIGNLCRRISELCKELDGKIKAYYRKIFAERLKRVRKELRLTQAEFGMRLGLSQRGISNFENAIYEPSIATLVRVSKTANRPVGWFLGTE